MPGQYVQDWNDTLDELTIYRFKDVVMLEEDMEPSPNRSSCTSALLHTESQHGLPHTLNLKRWKCRMDLTCSLCGSSQPTTLHILNGCPQALNQGCFT